MAVVNVLGVDPGKVNAAYSVVKVCTKTGRWKVLEAGMMKHPVQNLTGEEVVARMTRFKGEVRKLKRKFGGLEVITAERFMTRGSSSMGTTIEVVGIQLALLAHVGVKKVRFITPAQWKNKWNKTRNLKEFYLKAKPIPPHVVDSTLIALYGADLALGSNCFDAARYKQTHTMMQIRKGFVECAKVCAHTSRGMNSTNVKSPRAKTTRRKRKGAA